MKYMVTFPTSSDTFRERVGRFLETGAPPPEGVTMDGRWHSIDVGRVFILAETDDARLLYKWVAGWADLIDFEIIPVITDDEAAPMLQEALDNLKG